MWPAQYLHRKPCREVSDSLSSLTSRGELERDEPDICTESILLAECDPTGRQLRGLAGLGERFGVDGMSGTPHLQVIVVERPTKAMDQMVHMGRQ